MFRPLKKVAVASDNTTLEQGCDLSWGECDGFHVDQCCAIEPTSSSGQEMARSQGCCTSSVVRLVFRSRSRHNVCTFSTVRPLPRLLSSSLGVGLRTLAALACNECTKGHGCKQNSCLRLSCLRQLQGRLHAVSKYIHFLNRSTFHFSFESSRQFFSYRAPQV